MGDKYFKMRLGEFLDYTIDFSEFLSTGETISTHSVNAEGLIYEASTRTTSTVTVWLSTMTMPTQNIYSIDVKITTNQSRIKKVTFYVEVI